MVELESLSKIGYGGYRVDVHQPEHEESLKHALQCGCTVLETASNYRGGRSEQLLGKVAKNKDVFVISKTGYIHSTEQEEVVAFHEDQGIANALHKISDDFYYSIAPAYLDRQLRKSHQQLGRPTLDAYLLHNPEYLFQGPAAKPAEGVYCAIKEALAFLESQVQAGAIRYYGISSNTFALYEHEHYLDFDKVMAIAKEVSTSDHFKFIEFPFNLLEQEAAFPMGEGKSLIARAHAAGMLCLGNRPFNANSTEGPRRLVTYPEEETTLSPDLLAAYDTFKGHLDRVLKEHDYEGNSDDFEVIQYLNQHWKNFKSYEQRDVIIEGHLLPLLEQLFDVLPGTFSTFATAVERSLKSNISQYAAELRQATTALAGYSTTKPMTEVLCQFYLDSGLDVVLVGMRSKQYVNQLKGQF